MKSILLFGSIFLISAAFIIQTLDVSVSSDLPTSVSAGVPIEFEVTINKSGVSGFSKFQMQLPAGFTAEVVDGKEGTFSFTDQLLKLIWVSLPAENPFKVKFKITSSPDVKGIFPLKGVFSYVQNGERQNKEFSMDLNVGGAVASATPSATQTSSPAAVASSTASNISFVRSLSQEIVAPLQSTVVTLEVNKGKVSGFGKITETIPVGFTAEQIETNGGIFSTSGNSVRILWMTLPAEETFKISYKLTADASIGKKEITGSFSYVKDDQTMLLNTTTNYLEVPSKEVVAQTTSNPVETQVESTPEPVASTVAEPAPQAVSTETPAPASTSSTDVSYRVQICATRNPVNTDYFVKNNNVQVKIYADMHEGWHKFTVGNYTAYSQARNYREAVRESYNIKNPFVTAYNNGNRITVQEALTISNQTWVP